MTDTLNPPVQLKLYELALEIIKLRERIARLEQDTKKGCACKTAETGMAGF